MATGVNGIATNAEVNAKIGSSLSPPNKIPTYAQIMATGGGVSVSGSYSSNQLVKYFDINKAADVRDVILYNWGTGIPINSCSITIQNTSTSNTTTIDFSGPSMPPTSIPGISNYPTSILAGGSGNLKVIGVVINNGNWTNFSGKVNLSQTSSMSGGTSPGAWINSINTYYFVSGSSKLRIDFKFP